jgi:hypothetical protein
VARLHAIGWLNGGFLALSGLGIGVIMGMSASPVAAVVVAGLLGVATAIVTVLAGLKSGEPTARQVSALPLLLVVVAVGVGGAFGIKARTRWLAPKPATLDGTIAEWAMVTGLPDTAVARRIFEHTNFDALKPEGLKPMALSTVRIPDACKDSSASAIEFNYANNTSRRISAAELCERQKTRQK